MCFGMKAVRCTHVLLLGLLGLPLWSQPVQPHRSLESGWSALLERHGGIEAAESRIASRRALQHATRSLLLPQLDLETRYTAMDEAIEIDLDPIRQVILSLHPQVDGRMIPPFQTVVQERDFVRGAVQMTWPLYTGGRITAARKAARASVAESEAQLRQTQSTLMRDYVRRYFAVALAVRALSLREEREVAMEKHLARAQKLEAAGQVAHVDVLHAQVSRDEAQRDRKCAASDLRVAQEALEAWTGWQVESGAALDPLELMPLPAELRDVEAGPDSEHPTLERLRQLEAQAEQSLAAEQGRRLPELYLFGKQELVQSGLTMLDPEWAVGVGMRWSLLDRSSRTDRIVSAKQQVREIRALEGQAAVDLRTLVLQSIEQWRHAVDNHAWLERSEELAREALRVREQAFSEGQATSLDVVDAHLAVQRVSLGKAMAQYESLVAAATTADAMGQAEQFWNWREPQGSEIFDIRKEAQ